MTKVTAKYLAWLPAIIIASAIFYFSAQPADLSTDMSDGVSRILIKVGTTLHLMEGPEEEYYEIIEKMSMPVRKTAHITEFAVFYLSLLFALFHWGQRGRKLLWTAFMFTVLYACTDEFHQLFVPGRAGRFTDVLIDSSGAFLITLAGLKKVQLKKAMK